MLEVSFARQGKPEPQLAKLAIEKLDRLYPSSSERLNREFAAVLDTPDIKERFIASGSSVIGGTPGELQAHLKAELAKYAKLIRDAGIKPAQ